MSTFVNFLQILDFNPWTGPWTPQTKEEKAKDDRATKDKKNLDPEEKARLEAEKEAEDKIKREKARLGAKKEGKVIFMMLGEDAEVVKHVVRDMVNLVMLLSRQNPGNL